MALSLSLHFLGYSYTLRSLLRQTVRVQSLRQYRTIIPRSDRNFRGENGPADQFSWNFGPPDQIFRRNKISVTVHHFQYGQQLGYEGRRTYAGFDTRLYNAEATHAMDLRRDRKRSLKLREVQDLQEYKLKMHRRGNREKRRLRKGNRVRATTKD